MPSPKAAAQRDARGEPSAHVNDYELILRSIGEGVHVLDANGKITFANPSASRMLGFTAEELLGGDQHSLIHHSRADGTPHLATDCAILAAMRDGEVRRQDNDVFWRKDGTDARLLPYVFEPVSRGTQPSARRNKGLGVGLSIARHLVELHGGTISAAAAGNDRGSTFSIALPRIHLAAGALAADVKRSDLRGRTPRLDGVSVLVVEDEPDTRELIAVLLEWSGAGVVSVDSAAAGLTALPHAKPHVVISDIVMPGTDGIAFMRALRDLPNAPPTIALTAYGSEDTEAFLRKGFDVYLPKPVEPDSLIDAVARVAGEVKRSDNQETRARG